MTSTAAFEPVAIVGRACLLPGARSPEELWAAIAAGTDLIGSVPADRWGMEPHDVMCEGPNDSVDRSWSDRGGYVRGFDEVFDPHGFDVPPEEILGLDPLFQWTLHTAREALRDAGRADTESSGCGAVLGNLSFPSAGMAAYTQAVSIAAVPGFQDAQGVARPDARNRFSSGLPALLLERALRLGAGAFALDAACASGLYAVKLACDRLHDGTADLMLAGAVNGADDLCIHLGFTALQALSRTGRSRPFHRDADGLVPAEGCAFVVLRRLADAQRDGDPIYGVIRGLGLSNDGRGRGMLVPSSSGQVRSMRQALDSAGLSPNSISLLECHATGTQAGDATEVQSAAEVYGECTGLTIGSLKSNLGHLITAAGVAGLIKVLEAMRHEVRPPTLNVDSPLDVLTGSPFRLLTTAEPWDRDRTLDGVLRAGVSAFGFGGNNAHLIVEEPGVAPEASNDPHRSPADRRHTPVPPVAVVALGVNAASACGRHAFADALADGVPLLDETGQGRMSDIVLRLADQRFPPNDLRAALPQQLAMIQAATEAVRSVDTLPGAATGVYVGMGVDPEAARFGIRWRIATLARQWDCTAEWVADARTQIGPPLDAPGVLGTMPNVVANRLNSQFDLGGPSFTVSSEEHSGLDALLLAGRALRAREIDAAIVGAVDMSCTPAHTAAAQDVLPEQHHVPGDAAVALVLKRLDDAERDGDTVLALVFDEAGEEPVDLNLGLGPGAQSLVPVFGHAHAAAGLVHVAAAVLSLHHRVVPGNAPLLPSITSVAGALDRRAGPRTAAVNVVAMEGTVKRSVLLAEAADHPAPSNATSPRLHVFSGASAGDVVDDLAARRTSTMGGVRLVIVADDEAQLGERADRARRHILEGYPPGRGVYFRTAPIGGDMAFVFTAAGAAYNGMGAELLRAIPELVDSGGRRFPLREAAGWSFRPEHRPTPTDYLWGTAMISQAHARLTLDLLGLDPAAAIGYSSGESNSLFAFGVWTDMAAMQEEIAASRLMDHELAVGFAAVARAWDAESAEWATWNVLAPLPEVMTAIRAVERVHVAIINTDDDVVIAGDAEACALVVERIGRHRCRVVAYNLVCHVPEVAESFHAQWRAIHTRAVTPHGRVRFYSNGQRGAYAINTEACADAITAQAESTLDLRSTIEAAYADGVRVFVEHGPGGMCTNFIRQILCDEDVVAVHLDQRNRGVGQVFEAIAALVAAGVPVDAEALTRRIGGRPAVTPADDGPVLTVPAHPRPVWLPPLVSNGHRGSSASRAPIQEMEPAPRLPPVLDEPATSGLPTPIAPTAAKLPPADGRVAAMVSANSHAGALEHQMALLCTLHDGFLRQMTAAHEQFLVTRGARPAVVSEMPAISLPAASHAVAPTVASSADASVAAPATTPAPPAEPRLDAPSGRRLAPPAIDGSSGPRPEPPAAPVVFDKDQLRTHASGRVSDLFGPMFASQDAFALQCRMPEPPLLLADRVVGLEAEPGVLGQGVVWTETDVLVDSWYLNDSRMPAGFMIEAGQADLLLISYMGIDLLNRGERVYRLLGCRLTYHGDLPEPGETLRYEIRVTRHAKAGEVRLFFFEYDCIGDGRPRLTVRDGQAGFFNRRELDDAVGILWDPEEQRPPSGGRVDPPLIRSTRASFRRDELVAFSEGRVAECFGPGFELAETHTRTPKIQAGPNLFIDRVTEFDPDGGPWGRGFMRCETAIADDAWFFDGHFKNDPCMPGNFMVEACIQALSFYLAAQGFTVRRDGWRFQPLPEHEFELKCRGEINPSTGHVAYEVHVEELWSDPHPTVIADVVGFVDGHRAFHAHRMGVELTPGWPLDSMPEILDVDRRRVAVASDADGFPFDWKAMIACAWGRPSDAFGAMYAGFDPVRRTPRLPGLPYHFISRVVEIEGQLNDCAPGMRIVAEYDIPADAWYFDENGDATMPFAVLLEAALQPCGWVATAVGSSVDEPEDLLFRNLDGTGALHRSIPRAAATLRTHVTLTKISRAGGMIIEGFDVECSIDGDVVYTLQTVFGFFPPDAFHNQVGLAVIDTHRAQLEVGERAWVDLTQRPARYCAGELRLAGPMLLMQDRAVHVEGAGDRALGIVVGEKVVDPAEWFFKAHFFQDPVQPGSLGLEALIQLLQFYVLDIDLAADVAAPRFEPLMLGSSMTWKYRGQVTPAHDTITTIMEITDVGRDERGPFVVGKGSLWCDGLRIYEVEQMGVRVVSSSEATASTVADQIAPLTITVDRESHPHLSDHAVRGTPVVPVALAVEWFAQALAGMGGAIELGRVRVLRGIVLDEFAHGGARRLTVRSRAGSGAGDHSATLELIDASTGVTHYECLVGDADPPAAPAEGLLDPSSAEAIDEIYGGVLFHGPRFQFIEHVGVVPGSGLVARVSRGVADEWSSERWITDPALVDAALQLALLWTEHVCAAPSLPTSVGGVQLFQPPPDGPCSATLVGRSATSTRITCDVWIRDGTGRDVAVLHGVETHVLPASRQY